MSTPELDSLPESRWVARCQFCKVESVPVAAETSEIAWELLQEAGWDTYQSVPAAEVRPPCKACGEKNASIMAAVAKAKKGRKRR